MDRSICYQEECAPGGCFMELAVQMVFIFVGKQFLMQFVEYAVPLLRKGRHTSTRSIIFSLFCLHGCSIVGCAPLKTIF